MDLHSQYPALADLRAKARRRLPHFVWEFLDSGTGDERTLARNRAALNKVLFRPSILHGEMTPDLTTRFLGRDYALPLGIAPVGMSGLIWPDAERLLAQAAGRLRLPYTLSTVASQTPEHLAPHIDGNAWFQLYPPRDEGIRSDILKRVKAAGFSTLVLTVDIPVASRRERQVRSGLTTPPRLTPRLLAQVAARPRWAMGMARKGMPRMRLIDDYSEKLTGLTSNAHAGYLLRASPDWDYLAWLRDHWQGSLIVKGVMRAEDSPRLEASGVDALWVSNHAGRQFDASPAPIEVLPDIRAATSLPLIMDSGVETGLDILRALALGANFVMMGRGFHYALAALGADGPDHLVDLLVKDLEANMGQIGAQGFDALPAALVGK
ncbi:alpha-hydroxy acid oxidase [uncultured Shimia sp.]|uniref:alpha-hydroxy acid oxidase n=1 Tax=uncultured Shimia sp. TaxID=573152 RepID=UPI00261FDB23|nr:alpha-hydroxy acid oxidase [uncultured Shimia sp.]